MKILDETQIHTTLEAETQRLLQDALFNIAPLTTAWWNYMESQINRAHKMQAVEARTKKNAQNYAAQEAAAWERAQHLFFALLPAHLDALRQAVAEQIEREFQNIPAADVAETLRAVDAETLRRHV